MEVKAISKHMRISAFKAREVTRAIQGMTALDAQDVLRLTPKKAAVMVAKTLKTAIANAENNNNLRVQNLFVKEAVVGEGLTIKRFIPKARGSAGRINKRTSHIRIILAEQQAKAPKAKRAKSEKTPKTGKAPAAKKAAPKAEAKKDTPEKE